MPRRYALFSGAQYRAIMRIFVGVRWFQIMRVWSSKRRLFSFDRFSGYTYRNLYGFARFPCDSTAFVSSCLGTLSELSDFCYVGACLKICQVSTCLGSPNLARNLHIGGVRLILYRLATSLWLWQRQVTH